MSFIFQKYFARRRCEVDELCIGFNAVSSVPSINNSTKFYKRVAELKLRETYTFSPRDFELQWILKSH